LDEVYLQVLYRGLTLLVHEDSEEEKMPKTPALDVSNLNPNVLNAEYAVRGAIAIKAQEYTEKLRQGEDLGFQSIVQCNIGTCVV